MDTVLQIASVLLPLLYLLAVGAYGFIFFAGSERAQAAARPLLLATLGAHLVALALVTLRWRQFPAATVSEALSLTAFAVAVVYALVEHRGRERSTGLWILAPAFLFQLLASLLETGGAHPDRALFHDPLFAVHASLGLVGYAAFVIAAAYGGLFLGLYREIKRRRFSTFFGKLPPLEVLERMMTQALWVGFLALTGAVVTGAVWAEQLFAERWIDDPKIGVTVVTWAFYGVALLLRHRRSWQGRQTAWASLAGFCAVLFSFVAVNLLFSDLHGFY